MVALAAASPLLPAADLQVLALLASASDRELGPAVPPASAVPAAALQVLAVRVRVQDRE